MRLATLPRRDAEAAAHLAALGRSTRPLVLAGDRLLEVPGALGALLPRGGVPRGAVIRLTGAPGAGITTLAFELAAVVTAAGEWAAAVTGEVSFGMRAAAQTGVALERFAVVRDVTRERWASVVAALVDGVTLVVAELPQGVAAADARRLVARARERGTVLAVCTGPDARRWPADAALTFAADGSVWRGLEAGAGLLTGRELRVRLDGQGAAAHARRGALAQAG